MPSWLSRAEERPHADLWPIGLRNPLPVIPIPLREGDPDALLDLKEVVDHIYDTGGYAYYIYDAAARAAGGVERRRLGQTFIPQNG